MAHHSISDSDPELQYSELDEFELDISELDNSKVKKGSLSAFPTANVGSIKEQ